jgi:glycine/D-amino acid oxidase-like deaminating enzyme
VSPVTSANQEKSNSGELEPADVVIVGGGFFGASLANFLAFRNKEQGRKARIVLVERESQLMARASLGNQARIHGGYHYPRSITTGLRSQENYSRFKNRYRDCVVDSFKKVYGIARRNSKVSGAQFELFCNRIGAPLSKAPAEIVKLFNPDLIEAVFQVEECAFDATKLREIALAELSENGIDVRLGVACTKISDGTSSALNVELARVLELGGGGEEQRLEPAGWIAAREVFLCTYARMNSILKSSQLPLVPIRNEFTEMALVSVPDELKNVGITVMCGPFFSAMPFPSRGLHSLSHVRYTPHFSWSESETSADFPAPQPERDHPKSKFPFMRNDAARYVPRLSECEYRDSIWEVKTLLPRNELDDARPILVKRNHGLSGLTCVIGGKIDNVFDMFEAL